MQVLKLNYRLFTWYSICPAPIQTHIFYRIRNMILSVFVPIMLILGIISSAMYFLKYIATDLENSFFAIYQFVSLISVIYVNVAVILQRHKVIQAFIDAQKIYEISECRIRLEFFKILNIFSTFFR